MADILDLAAARERRDGPDAEHVVRDDRGARWFRFTCSYDAPDGGEFGFDLWARDSADAEVRLQALKATGRVDGQVHAVVPW